MGLGTSVGLLGAVGEYSPFEAVAVGAGGGFNGWGGIWEVHSRFRLVEWASRSRRRTSAFTLEVSFSHGNYGALRTFDAFSAMCEGDPRDPQSGCYRPDVTPIETSWAQAELGFEFRYRSGYTLRPFFGGGVALQSLDWQCSLSGQPSTCGKTSLPPGTILVLGVALGYSLGDG